MARLRETAHELGGRLQQSETEREKWEQEHRRLLEHYEQLKDKHE